jgi:hypothetical protein
MIATSSPAAMSGTAEPVTAGRVVDGDGGCEQVHAQFLAIIAANYPGHPAVTGAEAGVAVGQRRRPPPRSPARTITAVLPGPPAGPGQRATPGRAGTDPHSRLWPRERSPPRGRPAARTSLSAHERR